MFNYRKYSKECSKSNEELRPFKPLMEQITDDMKNSLSQKLASITNEEALEYNKQLGKSTGGKAKQFINLMLFQGKNITEVRILFKISGFFYPPFSRISSKAMCLHTWCTAAM